MATASAELKPEVIYNRSIPSIATLRIESKSGKEYVATAFLALEPGTAVTAWHAIYDARKIEAEFFDGSRLKVAGVIDRRENLDLALIRIEGSERLPRVELEPAPPHIGSVAYVIGAPKGYAFSIANGLVSQVQTIDGIPQYQISCPISSGNSGGPVLNEAGKVIGIASWSKKGAQNVNFAVPAYLLDQLNPHRPVTSWMRLSQIHLPSNRDRESVRSLTGPEAKPPEANPGWSEFQQFLKETAGTTITIKEASGPDSRSFTFQVPLELH